MLMQLDTQKIVQWWQYDLFCWAIQSQLGNPEVEWANSRVCVWLRMQSLFSVLEWALNGVILFVNACAHNWNHIIIIMQWQYWQYNDNPAVKSPLCICVSIQYSDSLHCDFKINKFFPHACIQDASRRSCYS